jgi:hypothetical protein
MNWKRIAIVVLGSGWFFLASCTTGVLVGTQVVALVDARDVSAGDKVHPHFSVVVFNSEADPPYQRVNLREVARAPDGQYTFRLPQSSGRFEDRDSIYWFEVLEDFSASQVIEVIEEYRDGDNTIWSRYEVTESGVAPLSSRMQYFGYAFVALPYALGFSTLLYAVGRFVGYRNRDAAERVAERKRKNRTTLIFIAIYGVSVIILYAWSTPKETTDFSGTTARHFTIAGIVTGDTVAGSPYRALQLEDVVSGDMDLEGITFLLPQPAITINVGDIHRAEITEDHGEWQLVTYYYSNTRTSQSVYKAYADRVEPVSYRVTSSAGQLAAFLMALVPAAILTSIIGSVLNWLARRKFDTGGKDRNASLR